MRLVSAVFVVRVGCMLRTIFTGGGGGGRWRYVGSAVVSVSADGGQGFHNPCLSDRIESEV